MMRKPDCGTLPWLAAGLTILGAGGRFFLPPPASWDLAAAWPTYLFFGFVTALALGLAYLGWRCHVERQFPPPALRKLLVDLSARKTFSGTPSQYNKEAQRLLYGDDFAQYMAESSDYYTSLMASGFIEVTSVTDRGNKSDGTTDTVVNIGLTDKANALIRSFPQER